MQPNKQVRRLDVEGIRKREEDDHADRAGSGFDTGHDRPVNARSLSEAFLGHSLLGTTFTNAGAELLEDWVRCLARGHHQMRPAT